MTKLIVIDGIDGSGKSTQIELLLQKLKKEGKQAESMHFPQYGKKSAGIVEEYLAGKFGTTEQVGPYRASIFYACDRYAASFKIKELLSKGILFVSDRYVSASIAHLGSSIKDPEESKKFIEWLKDLEYNIFQIPKPDISILLKIDPDEAQRLMDNKSYKDIHETDIEHQRNAAKIYEELAEKENWIIIECMDNNKLRSIEDIHNELWDKIKNLL